MNRTILGILLIASAIAMTFLWTKPMWDEIQLVRADKAELENTLARFKSLQKYRDDLLGQYNSISKENISELDEMLPADSGAGILLVNLENLTKEAGASLKNIDIADSKSSVPLAQGLAPEQFQTLSFDMSVSASYGAFRSFLKKLEASRRIINVESIAFSSSKGDSYQFLIKAATYWRKK